MKTVRPGRESPAIGEVALKSGDQLGVVDFTRVVGMLGVLRGLARIGRVGVGHDETHATLHRGTHRARHPPRRATRGVCPSRVVACPDSRHVRGFPTEYAENGILAEAPYSRRLRKKLAKAPRPYVLNVRGVGYRLTEAL